MRGFTAFDSAHLQGRCAAEMVLGYSPDISAYVQHEWYEPVWYLDSDGDSKIGRWMGVTEGIGGGDCFWSLPKSAKPIARSSVWAISQDEHASQGVQEVIKVLKESIESKIGNSKTNEEAFEAVGGEYPSNDNDLEEDGWTQDAEFQHQEADEYMPEMFDDCISSITLRWRSLAGSGCWLQTRCQWESCLSCSLKSHPQHGKAVLSGV